MFKITPYPLTKEERDRFWSKVDRSAGPGECWPWTGGTCNNGYGRLTLTRGGVKQKHAAHRIAYTIAHGDSVGHVCVCHHCDNTSCCNPSHLWLGSHRDNMLDRDRKGRANQSYRFPCGEQHPNSKLTSVEVDSIRELHSLGTVSMRKIGHRFGVSHTAIRRIVTNKVWRTSDHCQYCHLPVSGGATW